MSSSHRIPVITAIASLIALTALCGPVPGAAPPPDQPLAAPPLPDGREAGERQMKAFRVPDGLAVDLFATEPLLANPVAIAVDERNRVFVAEEYRFNAGVAENRTQGFLLEDDLRVTTLEERRAMFEKHLGRFSGGWEWFTRSTDQLRRVEDRDGDGRADDSTVFASGFNKPLDGLAAGVITRDGDVWFTCIPTLWRLRDRDGDGVADDREPLLEGFGVNASFFGHDLHGLTWGPDGRLYFSIGDRGFDVRTREGTVAATPRRGAVFRCLPDGREFEVLHVGLRNPQELAFDAYGNLFAADNNSDHGDHSRLVYVVEGGDSGWDMAYQTIPPPYKVGPWMAERMFHVDAPDDAGGDRPAWVLPPVGKLGAGPSGFAFYPGTGLPDRYRDHFFLCNFTGNGGVESFAVKPKGAAFEIVDAHDFLKPLMATDVEFAYDGRMIVSDFVEANPWGSRSRGGRLYRVFDPRYVRSPDAAIVRVLFAAGFARRGDAELATLLHHPDIRVRQRSQFALAARGLRAREPLRGVVADRADLFARLHGLWGLGQIAREHRQVISDIAPLLADEAAEVRSQAAKLLGELPAADHGDALVARLADADPRVRMHAALALGRLRHRPAVQPLIELARANADQDRYLRHAVVVALAAIDDREAVAAAAIDRDAPVRLAALLVMRRWRDPRIAGFLDDTEIRLVTEAARAIHDLPLPGEPALKLARSASRITVVKAPVP
jgi:quinoprotein glucose dehydrogenase